MMTMMAGQMWTLVAMRRAVIRTIVPEFLILVRRMLTVMVSEMLVTTAG